VTIPNSVTSIGRYAFASTNLSEVAIPNPDCVIAYDAFDSSVTIIGAFITDFLTYRVYDNSVTIRDCSENASGTLVIPSSYKGKPVTKIGDYAFAYCTSLTSVTIPDSVTSIGEGAFALTDLTEVVIPNETAVIANGAFDTGVNITIGSTSDGQNSRPIQKGALPPLTLEEMSNNPFSFSYHTEEGKTYKVECSTDLIRWYEVDLVKGTGNEVKFTDKRQRLFQQQFYRIRIQE